MATIRFIGEIEIPDCCTPDEAEIWLNDNYPKITACVNSNTSIFDEEDEQERLGRFAENKAALKRDN